MHLIPLLWGFNETISVKPLHRSQPAVGANLALMLLGRPARGSAGGFVGTCVPTTPYSTLAFQAPPSVTVFVSQEE